MKKIFVTGISSALVRSFIDSLDPGKYSIYGLSRDRDLTVKSVKVFRGDLLDKESYRPILENVDVILHAAALTHTSDEAAYERINTNGTIDLVDAALQAGITRFVYVSSRSAVPGSGAYGLSKLRAEEYVKSRFDNYAVVRPSEIFGVGKSEGIEKLIRDALDKRFHVYPAGVPTNLSPVHVADVGKVLAECIEPNCRYPETVTVGGAEEFSYSELIKAIGNWTGKPKTAFPLPGFVLKALAGLLRVTGIKTRIVPDQVQRLYAAKEKVNLVPSPPTATLKQYVLGKA